MPLKIAFVCVGNSARSQIAEGIAKKLAKEMDLDIEIYSAGSNPLGYIHPLAIRVMREVGIDISNQYSKHLRQIPLKELDYVFLLCKEEQCPYIPYGKVINWQLPDPSAVEEDLEKRLQAFREIRDLLEEKIRDFFNSLTVNG